MEPFLVEIWQLIVELTQHLITLLSSEGFRWFATFLVAIGSLIVAKAALNVARKSTASAIAMQKIAEMVERREVRPFLLIPEDAWTFKVRDFPNGRREAIIRFSKLRNAGSGPATYLVGLMRVGYPRGSEPPVQIQEEMGQMHIHGRFEGTVVSFIPKDETADILFEGHFPWPEVGKDYTGGGIIYLKIEIYFSDVEGRRYQTVYSLLVSPKIWSGAPGVQVTGPKAKIQDGKLVLEGGKKLRSEFDTAGAGVSYLRMESKEWTGKIDQNFLLQAESDTKMDDDNGT